MKVTVSYACDACGQPWPTNDEAFAFAELAVSGEPYLCHVCGRPMRYGSCATCADTTCGFQGTGSGVEEYTCWKESPGED